MLTTTDPRRSIKPANVIQQTDPPLCLPPGREHAWVQDDAATEDPPMTDPRLLRPAASPTAASSGDFHPPLLDDPCNYLG